jgi:hypothetical protein
MDSFSSYKLWYVHIAIICYALLIRIQKLYGPFCICKKQ